MSPKHNVRTLTCPAVVFLLSFVFGASHLPAQTEDKAEVEAAVLGIYSALTAEDADWVEQYVKADGYSEFSVTGRLARIDMEYIREVLATGIKLEFSVEDLEIERYGDSAIVTGYRIHSTQQPDGTSNAGRQRLSMMWATLDGGWKLVHVHLSPAGS